ncbi:MAG: HlyD family efflux transporter periplasmic adaptor subunit [Clostridiales bacterium]|nr:HlyD family efflux transporter periplasmic adaptor subunit [Clostridiales bacterium]
MEHQRRKKKIKKSTIIKIVVIAAVVLLVLTGVVIFLQKQVKSKFAKSSAATIKSAAVESGSISTTVYGKGRLKDDDVETQEVPDSVKLTELKVEVGDTVNKGDVIATADLSTVLSAMSETQASIDSLDKKIKSAADDEVDDSITTTVAGRIKKIYAAKGDDVSSVMIDNNALALLSMDGYMAVDIEAAKLEAGDKVKVTTSADKTYDGTVESKSGSKVTIILTDDGPAYGDKVTVKTTDGDILGTGELYVHDQLAIVGYAGTIKSVSVSENQKLSAGKEVFTLTDTSYTANYEQYLSQRKDLENNLLALTAIYRSGALTADYSGTVKSIPTLDEDDSSDDTSTVFEICPDKTMTVSVSIDETDILSLSIGQKVDVTVTSISDETFEGQITEIDRTGTTSSGVTTYTASIQIEKAEGMLAGMSASASISITSVENALIIPVDALNKTSTTAYVYTTYDEENDTFGGMTEVEYGISNSNYVEIKSGLKEGDTVYYKEKTTNSFQMPGGFGGSNSFPGGGSSGNSFPGGDFSGGNFPGGGSGNFPGSGSSSGSGRSKRSDN